MEGGLCSCGFEVSAVCVRVRFFGDLLCNRRVNGVGLENLGDACGGVPSQVSVASFPFCAV